MIYRKFKQFKENEEWNWKFKVGDLVVYKDHLGFTHTQTPHEILECGYDELNETNIYLTICKLAGDVWWRDESDLRLAVGNETDVQLAIWGYKPTLKNDEDIQ